MKEFSVPGPRAPERPFTTAQVVILVLLCLSVWLAYRPGLSGPFVFDDFPNITGNRFIAIDSLSADKLIGAALSGSDSDNLLSRPIPRVTFALNYYFAGKTFEPFAFKLTNLAIHAANVVLVYFFVKILFSLPPVGRVLSGSPAAKYRALMMAAFSAGLWGLHPLNLTSVLYAVQRMNSLSAFFVLAGLLVFVHGRISLADSHVRGTALMAGGIVGGVSLGILSKENALLMPLLTAVVELVFFTRRGLSAGARRNLSLFYLFFLGLPLLLAGGYAILNPDFLPGSYATREFSMAERLLTEPRVLFFYLSLIAFPAISRFGFYHDDFPLSTGLLAPPSTLVALLAWCLIMAALVWGLRRRTIWAFGLAWFLAGHALESTLIGLEIVHEHRNYLPSIGICVALVYYLTVLFERLRSRASLIIVSGLCALLGFGFVTHARAGIWSARVSLYESMVRHHPGSYRALAGLAITMMEQKRDARDVYKTYRDAARAEQRSVYPLVWMERILQALISSRSAFEGGADEPSLANPVEVPWDADPLLNRSHLVMLERSVSSEIGKRLSSGKTHVETVLALTTAQECLMSGRDDCTPLRAKLLDWHFIALDRLHSWGSSRAQLELSIARLYAERGELGKAEEFVDRAISSSGGGASYRLEKALLLIKIGKLEQARQIADEIERGMGWRRTYADEVEYLRREVRRAESAGES